MSLPMIRAQSRQVSSRLPDLARISSSLVGKSVTSHTGCPEAAGYALEGDATTAPHHQRTTRHRTARTCAGQTKHTERQGGRAGLEPAHRASRHTRASQRSRRSAVALDSLGKPLAKHGQLLYSSLATPLTPTACAGAPLSIGPGARGAAGRARVGDTQFVLLVPQNGMRWPAVSSVGDGCLT